MKRRVVICVVLLSILLSACGEKTPTWEEQYDLGIRYLSEGNYEEAIIAFTAAIEIDSNQASAYVGRGDAYAGFCEDYQSALEDYLKALKIDETSSGAYRKAAKAYIALGDLDNAIFILKNGVSITNDQSLREFLNVQQEETEPWGMDFNEFNAEQQQYIVNLVDRIEQEDQEGAWDLLKQISIMEQEHGFSFTYNSYRIYAFDGGANHSTSTGGIIEIHPQDGTGFHVYYNAESNGSFSQQFGSGVCVDWNWNGPYTNYDRYFVVGDSDTNTYETGTMKDGLLNGNVYETTTRVYVEGSGMEERTIDLSEEKIYKNGISISDSSQSDLIYSAWSGFSPNDSKALWDWREER